MDLAGIFSLLWQMLLESGVSNPLSSPPSTLSNVGFKKVPSSEKPDPATKRMRNREPPLTPQQLPQALRKLSLQICSHQGCVGLLIKDAGKEA